MTEIEFNIARWLLSGEKGLSSECIAAVMLGINPKRKYHPCDPSDFKRCLLLVNAVPEIRENLWKMKAVSEQWSALIDHWDKVEKCFLEEVPDWMKGNYGKSAKKTYELMQSIGL